MRSRLWSMWFASFVCIALALGPIQARGAPAIGSISESLGETIRLPTPEATGTLSVEEAIKRRRTVRSFSQKPLNLEQVSQLLWSAQGITDDRSRFLRAAPSAGALYPLELYLICGKASVTGLAAGVWSYAPETHSIRRIDEGDRRDSVAIDSGRQMWAADAPVSLVIACEYARTARKYGARARRYVYFEAGNVSQNVYLECESLGLSTAAIGAFSDDKLSVTLKLPPRITPLLVMPVGYRRGK
ncbi:SagB/ThcOx family dehydrogenase [bacterium]|nr:SagB/ThcOx family dehydrogenase [bacterium]